MQTIFPLKANLVIIQGMAKNIFAALFGGTKHDKDMRRLRPLVEAVNNQASWAEGLSEEEMKVQTARWKAELAAGSVTTDQIMPKAFARTATCLVPPISMP